MMVSARAALPAGAGAQPRRRARRQGAPSPADPRSGTAPQADAGLRLRLQASDLLQHLLPDVQPAQRAPRDDPHRADRTRRHRHRRRREDRDRHAHPRDRLRHLGRRTSRRSRSSGGTGATSASGGARTASRPTRASPCRTSRTTSRCPARTPTAACRTSRRSSRRCGTWLGSSANCAAAARRTFEVTEQANAEFLDRMRGRLGDSVFNLGLVLDGAQLLLQPARRGGDPAADVDDQRVPRGRPLPARRLRLRLTRAAAPP